MTPLSVWFYKACEFHLVCFSSKVQMMGAKSCDTCERT